MMPVPAPHHHTMAFWPPTPGSGFVATTTVRSAERSVRCLRLLLLLEDPRRTAQQELEAKAALQFRWLSATCFFCVNLPQLFSFG